MGDLFRVFGSDLGDVMVGGLVVEGFLFVLVNGRGLVVCRFAFFGGVERVRWSGNRDSIDFGVVKIFVIGLIDIIYNNVEISECFVFRLKMSRESCSNVQKISMKSSVK